MHTVDGAFPEAIDDHLPQMIAAAQQVLATPAHLYAPTPPLNHRFSGVQMP